ncbi:MAG TPA: hypothetical protein VF794_39485 [Archangium sp.]|jgi:hypothetical protein|uniref:hypothetical protein n=1 Tax=Archangium sp. TaxID=1872627 RepID=UPI002ED9FD64
MRSLHSWSLRSLLALGLLVGGGAADAAESPAISVRLPFNQYNLQLRGEDVVSLSLQLHRTPTGLRGRAFDVPTQLTLKEGGVSGVVGSTPVNLKVRQEGDTVHAEGGFINGRVTLRFSPAELHVYINQCTYKLTYTEGRYMGPRSCDSRLAPPVELAVPSMFQALTPVEQATLLLFALTEPDRV